MENIPEHLKKYIVQQNYERYTPVDQAVWRYTIKNLKKFLIRHAHESYEQGLVKTGIETEEIPRIEVVSEKLKKFGWRALPVSGFIPPAAFMELQSLSILPIACDMRSIDHLQYTPAPDIVHEAAGHAPILSDESYARYLKQYAQVAKKSILSKQDLDQYEAIRELSDLKENPSSSILQLNQAEEKLKSVSQKITFISEASELSRMNWWTAEYGLIKKGNEIKIFGAGLLSSVSESKRCLSSQVKKIPLTADCVKQGYDITEPQPQLFVTESFAQLALVLDEFSNTMAYKQGGTQALDKLLKSETVNSVQFENDLQVSGILNNFKVDAAGHVSYLKFDGPVQLCYRDHEIKNHGTDYHKNGYGTPIGTIENFNIENLKLNEMIELNYSSLITAKGTLAKISKIGPSAVILTLSNATCVFGDEILFKPEWGNYDIIIANNVVSGFGGPADRLAFGEVEDFVAARIPVPEYSEQQLLRFDLYQSVRDFRHNLKGTETEFQKLFFKISQQAGDEWLLFIELIEISYTRKFNSDFEKIILFHLENLKARNTNLKSLIEQGILIAGESSDATP